MKASSKYIQIGKITWKTITAYPIDTWLSAGMSGVRVLLSILLWLAIYQGQDEVGGYTLPLMITYALLAAIFGKLQMLDAIAWQLADEVREGIFSKYLVLPVSVTGYFLSVGLGKWLYQALAYGSALVVFSFIFSKWLIAPDALSFGWILLLLPAGAVCMLMFNHAVSLLSLKHKDISGVFMLKGNLTEFLSGTLIPLSLFPAPFQEVLKFTPFYYVVYYPASLLLGKQDIQPWIAMAILIGWSLVFWVISRSMFHKLRYDYEGVGI